MIYLVEDDNSIRELVIYTLQSTGFSAKGFSCAREFWEAMKEEQPSMALLDIMLPDEDGLTILRKLRDSAQTARLPVIMLTAKGTEYDKVIGLDSGADRLHSKALWNDGAGIPGTGSASESGARRKRAGFFRLVLLW